MNNKKIQRIKRHKRIRGRVSGTQEIPRLAIFRSNRFLYAQLINDEQRKTILGISSKEIVKEEKKKRIDMSKELGIALAKKALLKKVTIVVFDRGGYLYHGRVKAFAEGAREGGLQF